MKENISIEKEIAVESVLRGCGFDFTLMDGFGDPFVKVYNGIREGFARALDTESLPADIVARSEVQAERDAEAERVKRQQLDWEAAQLEAEINKLDVEDAAADNLDAGGDQVQNLVVTSVVC